MENFNSIVESLLFVSGEPVGENSLIQALGIDKKTFKQKMKNMIQVYNEESYGIQVIKINDGYQLVTKEKNSDVLNRLLNSTKKTMLSNAAMEVLMIIAYKQPVTRVEIEEIRGARCEALIGKLFEKGLLIEMGRLEALGKPILYGTSNEFLRQFGFSSIEELPSLKLFEDYESSTSLEEVER